MGFFTPTKKIRTKDIDKAIKGSGLSHKREAFAAGTLRDAAKSGGGLTRRELDRKIRGLRKDTKDPLRPSDVRKLRETLKDKLE